MMHVTSRPGVEIIDAQDLIAAFQQAIAKVRSNKSGSAGDEGTTFGQHKHPPGVAGRHPTSSSLRPSNWASLSWLTNPQLQPLGPRTTSSPPWRGSTA